MTKISVRTKRTSNRLNREDGDVTKARIIEAAGQLFAERGYADTTSKEISEAAGVNQAAINYHFGSRDGLYIAVLGAMHNFITSPDFLAELEDSPLSPKEKLIHLLDRLGCMLSASDSWQVRLWARETVSPSSITLRMCDEKTIPNFDMAYRLLSQITGIPMNDEALEICFLHAMSPVMVLMLMKRTRHAQRCKLLSPHCSHLAEDLKELLFSGLDAFAARKRKPRTERAVIDSPL